MLNKESKTYQITTIPVKDKTNNIIGEAIINLDTRLFALTIAQVWTILQRDGVDIIGTVYNHKEIYLPSLVLHKKIVNNQDNIHYNYYNGSMWDCRRDNIYTVDEPKSVIKQDLDVDVAPTSIYSNDLVDYKLCIELNKLPKCRLVRKDGTMSQKVVLYNNDVYDASCCAIIDSNSFIRNDTGEFWFAQLPEFDTMVNIQITNEPSFGVDVDKNSELRIFNKATEITNEPSQKQTRTVSAQEIKEQTTKIVNAMDKAISEIRVSPHKSAEVMAKLEAFSKDIPGSPWVSGKGIDAVLKKEQTEALSKVFNDAGKAIADSLQRQKFGSSCNDSVTIDKRQAMGTTEALLGQTYIGDSINEEKPTNYTGFVSETVRKSIMDNVKEMKEMLKAPTSLEFTFDENALFGKNLDTIRKVIIEQGDKRKEFTLVDVDDFGGVHLNSGAPMGNLAEYYRTAPKVNKKPVKDKVFAGVTNKNGNYYASIVYNGKKYKLGIYPVRWHAAYAVNIGKYMLDCRAANKIIGFEIGEKELNGLLLSGPFNNIVCVPPLSSSRQYVQEEICRTVFGHLKKFLTLASGGVIDKQNCTALVGE